MIMEVIASARSYLGTNAENLGVFLGYSNMRMKATIGSFVSFMEVEQLSRNILLLINLYAHFSQKAF